MKPDLKPDHPIHELFIKPNSVAECDQKPRTRLAQSEFLL